MPTSTAELKASLEGHNAEFEALLRLIPAKYYLVPEDMGEQSSKYQTNTKKQKAPKQAIKDATKKAKRDKLDPANNKSIIEIQEDALKKKKKMVDATSKKKGKGKAQSEEESDSDVEELELDMNAMDVDAEEDGGVSEEDVEYTAMAAPGSVEVLRAKWRARVEELREKKGPKKSGGSDVGGKDELLEERRQQRAAMRERRRKETKERKRREEEEKGKKGKGKAVSGPQTKSQLIVPDTTAQAPSSHDSSSKFANVTFSNISGSAPALSKSLKTSSNPTQALAQLAKRAEARAGLPADKQKELATRDAWAKAAARVSGAKVHDDTARLQKAVKRREREKTKSKKGWDVRKEQLVAAQSAKQKKRTDNIATRNERRKGGSGKKDTKKRPGFEGKSFGGGGAKKAAVGGKGKR